MPPNVTGDMREWLEQQSRYFRAQIENAKAKRHREHKSIRRKVSNVRNYNHKIEEFKRLKKGIDDMLNQQNWEV